MFIYKNNRVHVAGLSFAIPDGCILNWMNTEVEIEGFSALTPDGKIKFSLLPEIYLKGLKNEGAKERFEDLMVLFNDISAGHTNLVRIQADIVAFVNHCPAQPLWHLILCHRLKPMILM